MNLMPLAMLLEDNGIAVRGKTLFIDMLPAEASRAILLRNSLKGTVIDYNLPNYFHSEVQVIVRTPVQDYESAEALMEAVMQQLTFEHADFDEYRINYCRPQTLPVTFPLSVGNLVELSIMLDCCFVRNVSRF